MVSKAKRNKNFLEELHGKENIRMELRLKVADYVTNLTSQRKVIDSID